MFNAEQDQTVDSFKLLLIPRRSIREECLSGGSANKQRARPHAQNQQHVGELCRMFFFGTSSVSGHFYRSVS